MSILQSIIGPNHKPEAAITSSQELADFLLSGKDTFAGIPVNSEMAMRVAAVYACVRVLAESVAQLPLLVYRKLPEGGKERAINHPVFRLLHDRPNEWQTSFEFRETLMGHVLLRGNAYAFINRVQGRPQELIPIRPDWVEVKVDSGNRIFYEVTPEDGRPQTFPRRDIFHLKGLSADGFVGLSPVGQAREAIGLAIAQERFGASLFKNGARPSGILSADGALKEDQIARIRESWQSAHGAGNTLGTAVLDGGLKWTSLSLSNEDAQFLESRKFQLEEIARMYRVPPHKIGILDRSTFSNIEQQALEFITDTLMPWLRRWEQAISRDLISDRQGSDVFAEFLVDGLLRGDSNARSAFYSIMVQNKLMTRNEIRERENLNPVDGGDEFENPAITPGNENEQDEVSDRLAALLEKKLAD